MVPYVTAVAMLLGLVANLLYVLVTSVQLANGLNRDSRSSPHDPVEEAAADRRPGPGRMLDWLRRKRGMILGWLRREWSEIDALFRTVQNLKKQAKGKSPRPTARIAVSLYNNLIRSVLVSLLLLVCTIILLVQSRRDPPVLYGEEVTSLRHSLREVLIGSRSTNPILLENLLAILERRRSRNRTLRASFGWYSEDDQRLTIAEAIRWTEPAKDSIFFEPLIETPVEQDRDPNVKRRRGLAGYVFARLAPLKVDDTAAIPLDAPYEYKLHTPPLEGEDRSIICVPVYSGSKKDMGTVRRMGVLSVSSSEEQQFDDDDKTICEMFADLACLARLQSSHR